MKSFFSCLALLTLCFFPLLAQEYLDKDFHVHGKFIEGKTFYSLKPSQDTSFDIFDLEDNLIGKEEREIKQTAQQSYRVRIIYFYDENNNIIERHKLTNSTHYIRNSTYLNKEQQVLGQEQYKDGILTYRSSMDPITNEMITDDIILPGPTGGMRVWNDHVVSTLRYPKEAIVKRRKGTVYVSFEIDSNGNLGKLEVTNPNEVHSSLAKEAIRVITQFKGGWQPHVINGEAISSMHILPIVFQMVFRQL